MPEKTHGGASGNCRLSCGLLELLRRFVAERRVQTGAIIVLVEEGLDVRAQMLEIPIVVGINLLSLEGLHKTLAAGIVVRVPRATHTRNHLVLMEHLHVFIRSVLHTAI